jgi:hypothetical protein
MIEQCVGQCIGTDDRTAIFSRQWKKSRDPYSSGSFPCIFPAEAVWMQFLISDLMPFLAPTSTWNPDFLVIFSRELVKRDGRNNRTLQFPTFAQIHEQARHLQRSNRDTGAIGRTSGILLRMRRNRRPSDARKGVEFEPEPH